MEDLNKVIKNIERLIEREKSDYIFNKSRREEIKNEVKRLKLLKKQISSGNFGVLTDQIELKIETGINRHCFDYMSFELSQNICYLNNDILRCIRCGNNDYSITNKDGIVLKDFIITPPKFETYSIYFDGFIPKKLYEFIKEGNYSIKSEENRKLIYSLKNKR